MDSHGGPEVLVAQIVGDLEREVVKVARVGGGFGGGVGCEEGLEGGGRWVGGWIRDCHCRRCC